MPRGREDGDGGGGRGGAMARIDGGNGFTLPLCIRVSLRAKWSCRTMTRGGSGWAERRWVDLSRSFCACRCRSCFGIPSKKKEHRSSMEEIVIFVRWFHTKHSSDNSILICRNVLRALKAREIVIKCFRSPTQWKNVFSEKPQKHILTVFFQRTFTLNSLPDFFPKLRPRKVSCLSRYWIKCSRSQL